ncbi:uncharacterized protein LOC120479052 [Pimephales promelas]|uniref:uncharacterized protein LOC120477619 n=1 Tax=Pimephales promelas TaxID=90988 RepID=UPI001955700D|nr:uncharacterized protein LOC120477619 [Pimephales promelas]XP_039527259.1 uncharacterized protein LOC120479052 [Pimephales promelas]
MQSPSGSPFADIIQSLAALQRDQHQALLSMKEEQDQRFQALLQGQQEDRELFRSCLGREIPATPPPASASATPLTLGKMGPQDDPEAFLDLFERSAEAREWPKEDWPLRLIPLLSGESQIAAHQLPVSNLLVYDDLKRAIIQRVGRTAEQHRQRFRSLTLEEAGRPFVLAQQLRDSCRKWLMAEGSDVEKIINQVVLEQFVGKLPKRTAQWVQCHRPTSLDQAIQLAEDHMVACSGVGESLPSVSLSPSLSLSLSSKPLPAPRSRGGLVPRPAPRWKAGWPTDSGAAGRTGPRGPTAGDTSTLVPGTALSPRQSLGPLPSAGAAVKPGPACWRCGDPDHFIDRCPVMEVGTLVRIPDAPTAAPDQAGLYQIP